jgi:hypothetical protein
VLGEKALSLNVVVRNSASGRFAIQNFLPRARRTIREGLRDVEELGAAKPEDRKTDGVNDIRVCHKLLKHEQRLIQPTHCQRDIACSGNGCNNLSRGAMDCQLTCTINQSLHYGIKNWDI